MAYADTYVLAKEEQIIQRLTVACAEVARDVFVEAGTVANHDVRLAMVSYAGPRGADFRRFAEEIALLLLFLNPTLAVSSTDAALKTAVAGLWTVYAQILTAKGLITLPAAA